MRAVLLGGLIVFAPLLLVSLFSLLMLFNSVNPFQLAFVTRFRVENRTAMPLWITPVGTLNSGAKGVLPQFVTGFPAFLAFRSRDIRVDLGRSASVLYDWDDINFTEVVVRDAQGDYRQLVVDPNPPKVNYYRNRQDLYVIESWDSLPGAADDVLAAAQRPGREWVAWGLFVAGFAVFGFYLWLVRVYRELP